MVELSDSDMIMPYREKEKSLGTLFLVCLLLTTLEAFLFSLTMFYEWGWSMIFICHLILILLICRWIETRFFLLLVLLFSLMGAIGSGICMLAIGMYWLAQKYLPADGQLLREMLYPSIDVGKRTYIYNRIIYGMEDIEIKKGVFSYQDIMRFGSLSQKRSVLEKIGRYFRPEFVPALQIALNDSNNTIRVYAGTIVTQIEKTFYDHFVKLQQLVKVHPDDPRYLLALAEHCERYTNSKLLTEDREEKIRDLAIFSYEQCLPKIQSDYIGLSLADLYLQSHKYEQSLEMIHQLKQLPAKGYLIQMQAHFALKHYATVRALARQEVTFSLEDPYVDQLNEMKAFWVKHES